MPFFSNLDRRSTVMDVFQRNPERFQALMQLLQEILRGASHFSAGERELMAGYVSGLNACKFCYGAHDAIAVRLGVEPQTLEALMANVETAPVDDRLKPVLAYIGKLTQTPSCMTQADVDAVLNAGWDESAIEDAIAICCAFNFMNRLVDAYGLRGSSDVFAGIAEAIATSGYAMPPQASPTE